MRFFLGIYIFACCFSATARGQDAQNLEHDGIKRNYLSYTGKTAASGPRPLLVYLHGYRPPEWKNWRYPQLESLADKHGLVVLNPEAINFRWNYADPEQMQSQPEKVGSKLVDDVGFLTALIDDRINAGVADPARVYVLGDSRGGLMAYQLACRASKKLTAIGPMIASMTDGQLAACKPERPTPVLAISGTMDDNIFYDGWIRNGIRQSSVPEVMDFWRKTNGCTDQKADVVARRAGNERDRTNVWRIDWQGCKDGAPVRLLRVNGGGHLVPSLDPDSEETTQKFGRRNHDFSGIEMFWDFVEPLRRN